MRTAVGVVNTVGETPDLFALTVGVRHTHFGQQFVLLAFEVDDLFVQHRAFFGDALNEFLDAAFEYEVLGFGRFFPFVENADAQTFI